MATKVEQVSSVEPRRGQSTVMTTPKVSKFGAKSGFVIPKNKLSGSLVPAFRGGGMVEGRDAAKEESSKQVQRKTKWGADLTEDAAVRKGRAIAYQTRVEQITQQLKSGVIKMEDDQDSESITEVPNPESSRHQNDDQVQKIERLELEKREAIGEVLKLNPTYKIPPDYKPLLKEAKVPIPLTRYPGYNVIGLILGSGSNTQKRLEEETGAKIRIHGTKAGTGEKGEITPTDGNEVQSAYEELYVHVSAETFEKVDAAVSLIELLVTPVSGNPAIASTTPATVSGDSVNVVDVNQKDAITATSYMMPIPVVNPGLVQPMMGSTQPGPLQVPFQAYRGPWFPPGPPQTVLQSHSGFPPPPNSSLPMPNSAIQFPPSPINPSNMHPFFGGQPQPNTSAGFSTAPRNPSFYAPRPQPLLQGMQRPYMPEARPPSQIFPPNNHPMPSSQIPTSYSMPPRPNPAMHGMPHQITGNQPLTPIGSSNGWPGPMTAPASQGTSNMMQMARPMGLSNVPANVMNASTPSNTIAPSSLFPSQSATQLPGTPINHPSTGLAFASRPSLPSPVPSSTPIPLHAQATSPLVARGPVHNLSANPVLGSAPVPLASSQLQSGPPSSVSVSISSFSSIKPPMTGPGSIAPVTAPRPHRPSSGDFTFQPVRPQLPASQTSPGPSNQSVAQNAPLMPLMPTVQPPPAPQAPSFRPAIHNFPSPQAINQAVQPQSLVRAPSLGSVIPFAGNSPPIQPPTRAMPFGNPNSLLPMSPVPQMGLQGFIPPRQMSNSPGSLPPRPVNPLQLQQNQFAPTTRPGNLLVSNQQISSNLAYSSSKQAWSPRGNQVYDPFSPTSVSPAPPQQGDNPAKTKKQEDDPEYDDLMASVGVR